MSSLLEETKFKADILTGYDALTDLLRKLEAGAVLQDWSHTDEQMVSLDIDDVASGLTLLRETLRSLIVGADLRKESGK